jgi:hypothetical protein
MVLMPCSGVCTVTLQLWKPLLSVLASLGFEDYPGDLFQFIVTL